MKRGRFIVIEGGDGAGKDTQIAFLKNEPALIDAVFTREPGGTELGKAIRGILLHEAAGAISLKAELFLFLGDRAEHVAKVIEPALASGRNVVSNRSWLSFIAYQICGREQEDMRSVIDAALAKIFETCPIDLAVILDVPVETGRARLTARGKAFDTMENMPDAAHERIRQGFLNLAKTLPTAVVIDGTPAPEEVWKEVRKAVLSAL